VGTLAASNLSVVSTERRDGGERLRRAACPAHDYFRPREPERTTHRQLEALGYRITLQPLKEPSSA